MNKFDEIKNDVGTRSRSLLTAVADIIESISRQNLAFASDFAGFTVAQVRLPTQASDFDDYRERSKDVYSKFRGQLKNHGGDLLSVLREVPGQVKDAISADLPAAPAKVAKSPKKATKTASRKSARKVTKTTSKKTAGKVAKTARKKPAKRVAKKVAAKKAA